MKWPSILIIECMHFWGTMAGMVVVREYVIGFSMAGVEYFVPLVYLD